MDKIQNQEIEKIFKIKSDFEAGKIDSYIIEPEYLEAVNLIYSIELNTQEEQIKDLKISIDWLYSKMQEIIKLNNKEQ